MQQHTPIVDGIEPEIVDRLVTRRDAIRKGATASAMLTWGLSLGSVPVALAALSKDVFAQAPSQVLDVLQFAFILENLENEFYKAVLGTSDVAAQNTAFAPVRALVTADAMGPAITAALQQIQKHEAAHVAFLRTTIGALGGTAPNITANDFDFTGGNGSGTGPFAAATTNLEVLLLAAQAFEDTGVRAYKGQAANLIGNDVVLEAALRIHSVEARHAGKLRRVRRMRNTGETNLRYAGYVRGTGLAAAGTAGLTLPQAVQDALAAIYGGATPEGNTRHVVFNDVGNAEATVDAATVANFTAAGSDTQAQVATMAFDEPLTKAEVIAIVGPFIKDDAGRGLP